MQKTERPKHIQLFSQKTNNVTAIQNHPEVKDDVNKIIEKEEINVFEIKINKLPANGGNYLAELYEIDIRGDTKNGVKEVNLFMKKKFENIDVIDALSVIDAYAREKYVYNIVFKAFDELQAENNVPCDEKFKMLKFYETGNPNTVVMENLTKKGFVLYDIRKPITLNYAEVCIKEIAKFHALSFALEERKPKLYEDIKNLRSLFTFTKGFNTLLENFVNAGIEVMNTEDKTNRVKKVIYGLLSKLELQFNMKENAVNCLCHDDYKVSNIMIKEKDGVIVKAIPLDFQVVHYGPPVRDLIYLIFTCAVEKGFRRKYIKHFKELYYNSLTNFLRYLKLDINDIYTRKSYDEDFERLIVEYGFTRAFNLIPFAMPPDGEYPDILDMASIQVPKSELYIEQINEVVDDFIEWGYI